MYKCRTWRRNRPLPLIAFPSIFLLKVLVCIRRGRFKDPQIASACFLFCSENDYPLVRARLNLPPLYHTQSYFPMTKANGALYTVVVASLLCQYEGPLGVCINRARRCQHWLMIFKRDTFHGSAYKWPDYRIRRVALYTSTRSYSFFFLFISFSHFYGFSSSPSRRSYYLTQFLKAPNAAQWSKRLCHDFCRGGPPVFLQGRLTLTGHFVH